MRRVSLYRKNAQEKSSLGNSLDRVSFAISQPYLRKKVRFLYPTLILTLLGGCGYSITGKDKAMTRMTDEEARAKILGKPADAKASVPVLNGPNQGTQTTNNNILQAAGQSALVCRVEGTPDLAQVITATIGIENVTGDSNGVPNGNFVNVTRFQAKISWGINGFQRVTVIDVIGGFTFSVPTNYLQIEVTLVQDTAGNKWNVFGGVAYGPLSADVKPRLTIFRDSVLGGGASTPVLEIPYYADNVRLYRSPNSVPVELQLIGNDPGGGTAVVGEFDANAGDQLLTPIPLPNDVHGFIVKNNGAANINRFRAIFELAL